MTFASLPLEILQHIAACFETLHRPSLRAFSLTNKTCHEASLIVLFQRINIIVDGCEGVRRDANRLVQHLSRTDSFRHVRQITLKGTLRLNAQNECWKPQKPWAVTTGVAEILDEEPIWYSGMYTVYDEGVIKPSSEEDMAWAPIVNLIHATTELKDLIYDCQSQFPPSLLQTLHEKLPQCRLHHLTFKFRTLLWGTPYPYEMELATSPSLYSVKVICAERDSDYDDDYNLEAIMELSAGLAPNLREVTILNLVPGRSLKSRRPRGSWSGLPGFTGENVGLLTSLSLKGIPRLSNPAVLRAWAKHTDFTRLQQLTLESCFESQRHGLNSETMNWMTQNCSFPRVKTLSIYLSRDDMYQEKPHYSEYAVSFFQNFNSLAQLSIQGPLDSRIVDAVLSHHGQTLEKLSFRPLEDSYSCSVSRTRRDIPFEFTKDRILQIKAQCPLLEELAIPIKRAKSSASEAELYKCLGGFESLRSLFLILDCSNWRVTRDHTYKPNFKEEDQRPVNHREYTFLSRGELKETFANCAVDETLARSIWNMISHNKIGRRLERLKLWPTGAGKYGSSQGVPNDFGAMAQNLMRSWLLERIPRDDEEVITVRELAQDKRKARDEAEANYLSRHGSPGLWEVFYSVLPRRGGAQDWRDGWSSLPLQEPA